LVDELALYFFLPKQIIKVEDNAGLTNKNTSLLNEDYSYLNTLPYNKRRLLRTKGSLENGEKNALLH
jgi:hypothetical protein